MTPHPAHSTSPEETRHTRFRVLYIVAGASGAGAAGRPFRAGAHGPLDFELCADAEEASARIAEAGDGPPPDAVLVDAGVDAPLALAARLRRLDARLPLIFLAPADSLEKLHQLLLFNPLVGQVWTVPERTPPDALQRIIVEAIENARGRRRLRQTLDQLNRRLADEDPAAALERRRRTVSERYLSSLLASAPDPILSTDAGGTVASWNDAAAATWRIPADQAVGRPLAAFFAPDATRHLEEFLAEAVAGGVARGELPAARSDGEELRLELTVARVDEPGGALLGLSVVARDVTERVRQQHALEEATAELEATVEELRLRSEEAEAASRVKSEFLAAMSHELRTPLQAVIGYASLLEDGLSGPLTSAQREQLGRIRASADHLLGLIDQVLDLSRAEVGLLRLAAEPVEPCALVRDAAELVRPQAAARGLDLVVEECPEGLQKLPLDPGRLRQILLNLLSNAIKFTDDGGVTVTLEVAEEREAGEAALGGAPVAAGEPDAGGDAREPQGEATGWLRIHVEDTGAGVPPEQLARIFQPFYQAEVDKSRRAAGMGLGLSISARLAEAMGGRITAISEPGRGSRFTLHLPMRRQE
jgi:PAS domain S-box-containing protein